MEKFLENLVAAIRDKLKITLSASGDIEKNGAPIIYDNKTKGTLKQLLILYNIEYIIQKNKENNKSYIIFPFDLFKMEKWALAKNIAANSLPCCKSILPTAAPCGSRAKPNRNTHPLAVSSERMPVPALWLPHFSPKTDKRAAASGSFSYSEC